MFSGVIEVESIYLDVNKSFRTFTCSSRRAFLRSSSRRSFLWLFWDTQCPSALPVEYRHRFRKMRVIHTSWPESCFHFPWWQFRRNIPRHENESRKSLNSPASKTQFRWDRNLIWPNQKHEWRIKWLIQLMWMDMTDLHPRLLRSCPIPPHRNGSRLQWIKFHHCTADWKESRKVLKSFNLTDELCIASSKSLETFTW